MDIGTLAASVLTLVSPLAAKSAEAFSKEAGKQAFSLAKSLVETLKRRWHHDDAALQTLNSFEKDPNGVRTEMRNRLVAELTSNKELFEELRGLVEPNGPLIEVIQRLEKANTAVGAKVERARRGKIKVTQEIKEGEDVTGVIIKDLG